MKWYSHTTYKQHLEDLKLFKDENELRQTYMSWAKTISNRFDRSYPRVGVLDLTDLLQEGYVAFYKAWEDLNWKVINAAVEPERPALITAYIKRRVHDRIVRAIARDRDTIRIPEGYYLENPMGHGDRGKLYNKNQQTDIFLTRTFSSFFTPEYLDIADDAGDYMNDKLNDFLNDIMETFLSATEKLIIKMFYGIDEPYDKPKPFIRISEYCSKSEGNVRKIKQRGLDKLKQEPIKEIITNYIENEVTK